MTLNSTNPIQGYDMGSQLNSDNHSSRNMVLLSENEIRKLTAECLHEDNHGFRRRGSESDSILSTSVNDTTLTAGTITKIMIVPTGLKVVALVSMVC